MNTYTKDFLNNEISVGNTVVCIKKVKGLNLPRANVLSVAIIESIGDKSIVVRDNDKKWRIYPYQCVRIEVNAPNAQGGTN